MKQWLLKHWWVFPLASIICVLLVLPLYQEHYWIANIVWIMTISSIILQLVTFILLLCHKKWWQAVGSILGGIVSCYALCLSFILFSWAPHLPDSFGKEHPIPNGMMCNIPLEHYLISNNDTLFFRWKKERLCSIEPVMDTFLEDSYLQIWNGTDGGNYQYSFYYPALPDGEVFLRCFEVTENIELSTSRLQKATTVKVRNHTDFGIIADKQQFSIYEGNWGDYYAARIEVWHRNASTGEETKLLEKIYRVEGWMR